MLLAVDIGNTNIVLGLMDAPARSDRTMDDAGDEPEKRLRFCWRLGTANNRTTDEYGALIHSLFQQAGLSTSSVDGIAICSVVPPLQRPFVQLTQNMFKAEPVVIEPGIKTGMPILYDNPKEVGADRIVNAIAAYHRYRQACIVVDFGTANTFDFVTPDGKYGGGVIAPGVEISAEALFHRAAKLPRVDLVVPERVIGRNTVGSMQAGLYFGSLGTVDRIVQEILKETRLSPKEVKVVATGGLATLLAPGSTVFHAVLPHLTLEGLEIVYYLNRAA